MEGAFGTFIDIGSKNEIWIKTERINLKKE